MIEATLGLSEEVGVCKACRSLGVSRATLYRKRMGFTGKAAPPRRPRGHGSHRALSVRERNHAIETLHSERFVDKSPAEVYATLLDEGRYICSPRTYYRILASERENAPRGMQAKHVKYARPELLATRPNELWSWDITKLKGPRKWTYYYLYVILDVFSRYVVGWMIAYSESSDLACDLISETIMRQGVEPGQLTMHADRGASMKSRSVSMLLSDLGVSKTHSRPHVSNDNPYSESQFKTLKYASDFPERFGGIEDAREHCKGFFNWYNRRHHHSGVAMMTPEDVHYNRSEDIQCRRAETLKLAYERHPERFVRGVPRQSVLPEAVWINRPVGNYDNIKMLDK